MIAGFVAIGIFLVGQLIAAIIGMMKAVAWAATVDTKLSFMLRNTESFMGMKDKFSTKEEVAVALTVVEKNNALALSVVQKEAAITQAAIDKELKAMWLRIDGKTRT